MGENNNNIVFVPPRGPRKTTKGERIAMAKADLLNALEFGDRQGVEDALLALGAEKESYRSEMATYLISIWPKIRVTKPTDEPPWAPLTLADAELVGQMSEGLMPAETCLLAAMVRCARARPHPTGRIRYTDDELMKESRIKDRGCYRSAFASLGEKGLVKVAVVGSKNPVTTIELPWLPQEGE